MCGLDVHAQRSACGEGGGVAWSGLGGAAGVLERVVHLLRSLRRSCRRSAAYDAWGSGAEIPHVRVPSGRPYAFRWQVAGGEPCPVYGLL